MKTLTLTQPWATLVAIGAKRIETRSWSTQYRGPLAIHAAKGFPKWAQETCQEETFKTVLGTKVGSALTVGCVLATCELIDVLPMEATGCLPGVFDDYPDLKTPQELEFGDYAAGRWAWILDKVKPMEKPVPARGALGLREWNPEA